MLKYTEFIEKVNEAGFWTPFTDYINPEIFTFTVNGQGQQYTGDPETDTTLWNTRAAQENKLACGHFFNGKSGGFIAPRFYSIFIDAFKPRMTVEERYETGKLGQYEMKIWTLLKNTNGAISRDQIFRHYGISAKEEDAKVEAALKCLEMTFDITISGLVEGVYKNGKPYTFTGYDRVDHWVPPEWMEMNPRMEHQEALEAIYHQAEKISKAGDAKKAFNKSLKLYKTFY
jgi:hypothetical protein